MSTYYVYQYLREDLTPYYIGKGSRRRAWAKNHTIPIPPDQSRIIIIAYKLTESEALLLETKLISYYGRKDLGTGILRNKTSGGEGASGVIGKIAWNKGQKQSPEYIDKRRKSLLKYQRTAQHQSNLNQSLKGRNPTFLGKTHSEETKKKLSEMNKGKTQPKLTCPYCLLTGGQANLKRYHFNNCKLQ
jgi:hypothetical protein